MVEYDQQTVDLGEWVKDKLARFQQPVRWLTLPPELKNGGIKISRQALKEWVQRQDYEIISFTSQFCHSIAVDNRFIC
ncbi:O-succinylbenzoic acid--CoA ligase [Shigella sonnei]|nr:O-succinylbenzoic acid--CoA ligase [Shigella sonnei]